MILFCNKHIKIIAMMMLMITSIKVTRRSREERRTIREQKQGKNNLGCGEVARGGVECMVICLEGRK